MRNLVPYFLTIFMGAVAVTSLATAQDWDAVEIEVQPVSGNVYMLVGQGGNIGVSAGEDGLLIVDDQFAPLADKIKAALDTIRQGDLEFVLNTHWHGDHTGGNPVFGLEAVIVAHDNVRKRLSEEQKIRGRTYPALPPHALPIITFDEGLSLHFNGEEIQMMHAPAGHTDGDSVIFFTESSVVHMGDHFFNGRFPFVDLASGGTVEGMARNVARVLEKAPEDAHFIPGHGPLASKTDLQRFHDMLVDSLGTVGRAIEAGKPLEAIQEEGLPRWEGWGSGFINEDTWIQTVYTSLRD